MNKEDRKLCINRILNELQLRPIPTITRPELRQLIMRMVDTTDKNKVSSWINFLIGMKYLSVFEDSETIYSKKNKEFILLPNNNSIYTIAERLLIQ